jgi:hypothetical protein
MAAGEWLGYLPRGNIETRAKRRKCLNTDTSVFVSTKLVSTVADRGCHVVSVTNTYGCNLAFLDRSRYFLFQVALQLYSCRVRFENLMVAQVITSHSFTAS